MRSVGLHLPHVSRPADADAIFRAACHAEELGYDDVWVSDHVAVPSDPDRRRSPGGAMAPSYVIDPIVSLTWAGAVTRTIGLGTSVLVLPYRHPLIVAKQLASLDQLTGGRVRLGAGTGWLRPEFEALGVDPARRGALMSESLAAIRACWGPDPVDHTGDAFRIQAMSVKPKPAHPIPVWLGGTSVAALERARAVADGWQGFALTPQAAAPLIARLRAEPFDLAFTISIRSVSTPEQLAHELDAFETLDLDHVLVEPHAPDIDSWLRTADAFWELLSPRVEEPSPSSSARTAP